MKFLRFAFGLLAFVLFTGCLSGPMMKPSTTRLRDFPSANTENFQLFLDRNTVLKTINGKPATNEFAMMYYGGLTSRNGNLITLPTGDYTIEVRWIWVGESRTSGNTTTVQTETYEPIVIKETFLPDRVYDIRIWKGNDGINYQARQSKGVVSWAKPNANETELIFPAREFCYFVYFNDEEDFSLAVEGPGLRYFIPNGNHTMYIRQGAYSSPIWHRRLFPIVNNVTNRSGITDDVNRSETISFTADGKKKNFRVSLNDPGNPFIWIPKKIRIR